MNDCRHTLGTWRRSNDGAGYLSCYDCGKPLTPPPTAQITPLEVFALTFLLLLVAVGAGWWFWWLWLA